MAYYDVDPLGMIAEPFRKAFNDVLSEGHAEYWLKGGRGSTKSSFGSVVIIVGMLIDTLANAIVYRITAHHKRYKNLDVLFSGYDGDYIPTEFDTGEDAGREVAE